jgi:hypothetical protein
MSMTFNEIFLWDCKADFDLSEFPPRQEAPYVTEQGSDALIDLKKLLDAGAITSEEYDVKKKVLLEKL